METEVQELAKRVVEFWTPERRIQGALARDTHGLRCGVYTKRAVTFCALGVVLRCDTTDIGRFLVSQMQKRLGMDIICANDDTLGGPEKVYKILEDIAEGK